MSGKRILICDDEPAIRKSLTEILEDEQYVVEGVATGEALLERLSHDAQRVDAVFLDVWLPGMDGVDTLARLRESGHTVPVIVISGHATLDNAVRATRLGAFDFLEKPLNLDKVVLTLANALRQSRLERRERHLSAQLPPTDMVGKSEVIRTLREEIALAAPSTGRVLIFGESGSGKELAARMIHRLSHRRDEPFVEMNCAAIPSELIESELFGHVKGSFTGAIDNRKGTFEQADQGTLFLDEIGDMAVATQAKVLRVLQEQRFQRIGGVRTIQVDVRVIAATNQDLLKAIEEGRFRKDLYYRLNVIPIEVPPLRARREDIPLLCQYFAAGFARSFGRGPIRFTPEALQVMMDHAWPGNVRELKNVVERLMIMVKKEEIAPADLPGHMQGQPSHDTWFRDFDSLKEAREHFERRFIEFKLKQFGGNISRTSEALQLERSNLHRKIKQLGIQVP